MSNLFWLDYERLKRIYQLFPKPREVARSIHGGNLSLPSLGVEEF